MTNKLQRVNEQEISSTFHLSVGRNDDKLFNRDPLMKYTFFVPGYLRV